MKRRLQVMYCWDLSSAKTLSKLILREKKSKEESIVMPFSSYVFPSELIFHDNLVHNVNV